MSVIQVPTQGLNLKPLQPYNLQYSQYYISQWRPVVVNENFYARDPQTGNMIMTRCFAINCQVDLTNIAGTAIHYVSEFGDILEYFPMYSGVHELMAWGITEIAAGVNGQTLQWGI